MKGKMRFPLVIALLLATTTLTASIPLDDQPNELSTPVGGDEHYWGYLTQDGASGYALDATTKGNWTFVAPYEFSGPNNWNSKAVDEDHHKRAVYTISGANLADVFSAKIYGKITQNDGQGGEIPDWSLEGKAKGDFRIEPDEVFMWIEHAKRYKSFEGDRTVDSKWRIKSLYGSDKDISLGTAKKIITVGPDLDFDSMELGPGKFIVDAVKNDSSSQCDSALLEIFKIDIKHNGNIVTDQTVDVSVSQRNQLEFDIQPADVKGMVSAYKWTVPGTNNDRVANYVPEKNKTTITKLESADLTKPSIKYHWITKSGKPREVKGAVTIDGKQYRKTASFNVTAPRAGFSASTWIVDLYYFASINMYKLSYGKWDEVPGITFTGNINGPGGKQVWQRVDSFVQKKWDSDGTLIDSESWNNRSDNYPSAEGTSYSDSPASSPLDKNIFTKLSISDTFTTWLMFKHPDGGIWVPLREIKWWWSGATQYNKTLLKWEMIRSNNNENPTSVESSKLPVWNGSAQE